MSTNLTMELARRMLAALPGDHSPDVVSLLAAGLTRGLAVIPSPLPDDRTVYVVLGSPLEVQTAGGSDFLPTFLVGQRSLGQRQYLCLTGSVAWWFRLRARGGFKLKPPHSCRHKWVRAATQSYAWLPVEGDLPGEAPLTPNPEGFGDYEWFDLNPMPIGSVIYRISTGGRMTLFQRLGGDGRLWGRLALPARSDAVDMHGLVQQLRAEHGAELEFPAVTADIPLMTAIPPNLSPYLWPNPQRRAWLRQRRKAAAVADQG
ncbi:MAG TPA: hypothetical protein VLI05_01470 [Candidatus Saccharimonadia bacterium]|nr:hypothetical protein [Candidatus Saccharimonadia bacterium]